ncbi:MAG TPA: (Fe-S)-binding protein [Fimbriimonas sp.]|nr:(Fe-S)-binding protein [Fimbriimonas sp.]
MLEGCAMSVLYPRVHQATQNLLARIGYQTIQVNQGCCGALHAHNGDLPTAQKLAKQLIKDLPKDVPIIVNSAGCGSVMKEYSQLLQSDQDDFTSRVFDLSEFLYREGLIDHLRQAPGLPGTTITYHDACHLAHGQRIASIPRELLAAIPGATLVELDEANTCCGSAGIYNILQPAMARKLLDRKVENINKTGATIVATGNPGCHGWIAQGCEEQRSARVMHTAEVLEAAFGAHAS